MHTCPSTQRDGKVKVAKGKWIAAKVTDWLKGDPSLTSIAFQKRLFEKYHVDIDYQRGFAGRFIALEQIFGKWEDSFECMHNWQAELLRKCPTSVVVIDHKEIQGQQRFTRAFVCFRACIDGFLSGCRPYLSVDATALNGKWKGQLAVACGVDGNNWLYPVAYAVFDSETKENWDWFMENLKSAIGTPEGLVICTDACKGLETTVHTVFLAAEHRECFRHMIMNFRKKYHGKVFEENLWPAAYTYSLAKHNHHMRKIMEANPEAIAYLDEWHSNLWSRSKFSTTCKCDYVMNNIAESFNSMIKKLKGFPVLELLDALREWLMVKFEIRAKIATKFARRLLKILPRITNMMNNRSRGIVLDGICRSDDCKAEVTIKIHGYNWKHCVDLEKWECSCRRWQVTGQPCLHAIAFITSIRGGREIDDYVHEYYSVKSFNNAYAKNVPTMTDKKQWPVVDTGFKLHPPVLKKATGRPRTQRIKSAFESISKRTHKCRECKELGHLLKTCPKLHPERKTRNMKRKNVEPQDIKDIEASAIDAETMDTTCSRNGATKKRRGGKRAMSIPVPEASKKPSRTHDSPAKNTRSKKGPLAKSTRSKKKL